jgi:LPS-assembly lipoprotein
VDENGKVREYELILQVGIRLEDEKGKVLIKNQNIRLSRDFLFEIDDVLGKTSEREQIYQEMREDIARLIVYRLQAITSS